jgi:hypothetical protein
MTYNPRGRNKEIAEAAWEIVQSLPYQVSLRYVFYALLQQGYYANKDGYAKWKKLAVRLRRSYYGGWRPWTLADDTRSSMVRVRTVDDVADWMNWVRRIPYRVDRWPSQTYYVECWFEARAMASQFRYYVPDHITLVPMGGQPSLELRWQCIERMRDRGEQYDIEPVVVYFGDLDLGGGWIRDSVREDVDDWGQGAITFIDAGLNAEQVQRWGVPENIERPGAYQWEAVTDDAARGIIESALEPYIDQDALEDAAVEDARGRIEINELFSNV